VPEDLKSLLESLRSDLAAVQGDPSAAAALALLSDPEAARLAAAKSAYGASRFATAEASDDVLARLAAGGSPAEKSLRRDGGRPLLAKALAEATNSAGGFLVASEIANDVYRSLRSQSAVLSMPGVRTVPVKKELLVNSISSGPAASYVAENAHLAVSEPVFQQDVLLRPKALGTVVPVSNRLREDAIENPELDEILRDELAEIMALRADLAFLLGPGTSSQPLGLAHASRTGTTVDPITVPTDGFYMSLPQVRYLASVPRRFNARYRNPGWIMNPAFLTHLEGLTDADGRFLADAGILKYEEGGNATLFGWPVRLTTQLPANVTTGANSDTTTVIFCSDWDSCYIGENKALEIATSSEAAYTTDGGTTWISSFQADQTLYRAISRHDIGLRRPNLLVRQSGIRVG
jgi:HK97 family phage major capsid protein